MSHVNVTHGFHLVTGKFDHATEDYVVSHFKQIDDHDQLGLFAVFDGHQSFEIPIYLHVHLLKNTINEPDFWIDPASAVKRAYRVTDTNILQSDDLKKGGATAVTAILFNCQQKLVVANVGDSRAVICKNGVAKQLSVDHDSIKEKEEIEKRDGYVLIVPGKLPRVGWWLAML
ncbi:unnamed protein product [Prunus armeniaca]|uniref:PPM-type phosphatase domain-containing protein n=1 Tax=Prunus armeniaca TaxID=36596 RepID=A0A6J5U6U7_PRUAR|nr:unnamed protein product [Prunus armeniaca]